MSLAAAEKPKLAILLTELGNAVEQVLLSGLTTASETTQKSLTMSLQEATRLRLLRFGATLRHTQDELGRYLRKEAEFSPRRLAFFLNRTWLMTRAMLRAIRQNLDAELDQLNWSPPIQPIEQVQVAVLGVGKKIATSVILFDFRMRALSASGPIAEGQRLIWTCLFPMQPNSGILAETYLISRQKQQFVPEVFLKHQAIELTKVGLAVAENGPWRITLTDASKVAEGAPIEDWSRWTQWSPAPLIERLTRHEPGPFDLEVDLQDEAVLTEWDLGEPEECKDDAKVIYPISWRGLTLEGEVSTTEEGKALRVVLEDLRKKANRRRRPPLYGLLHFDRCRPIFQPIALIEANGPEYVTLSKEKKNLQKLVQSLRYT